MYDWKSIVLHIVAGWSTIWIALFGWKWIPDPPPDGVVGKPQPVPWKGRVIDLVIGAVGGLAGGWAYHSTWVISERASGLEMASTVLGAALGATLLVSIYQLVTRR
jgi:uncharacterized membrane protein YeaQ/YmgE (transglycosylase-associated protein family)